MHEEHWVSLLESELNDIETIVYADLRKLVVEMRTKTSGIVPSGVWANKLEKLLDGGE